MQINNSNTTFNGITKNSTWSRLRKYAYSNDKKDEFHACINTLNKLKSMDIELSARHVKTPEEGNRVVIKIHSDVQNKLKGVELFNPGNEDITVHTFNILKQITNNTTELYRKLF